MRTQSGAIEAQDTATGTRSLSTNTEYYQLLFNTVPADALVALNPTPTEEGYPAGTVVSYTVSKVGCTSVSGTVTMTEDITLPVSLKIRTMGSCLLGGSKVAKFFMGSGQVGSIFIGSEPAWGPEESDPPLPPPVPTGGVEFDGNKCTILAGTQIPAVTRVATEEGMETTTTTTTLETDIVVDNLMLSERIDDDWHYSAQNPWSSAVATRTGKHGKSSSYQGSGGLMQALAGTSDEYSKTSTTSVTMTTSQGSWVSYNNRKGASSFYASITPDSTTSYNFDVEYTGLTSGKIYQVYAYPTFTNPNKSPAITSYYSNRVTGSVPYWRIKHTLSVVSGATTDNIPATVGTAYPQRVWDNFTNTSGSSISLFFKATSSSVKIHGTSNYYRGSTASDDIENSEGGISWFTKSLNSASSATSTEYKWTSNMNVYTHTENVLAYLYMSVQIDDYTAWGEPEPYIHYQFQTSTSDYSQWGEPGAIATYKWDENDEVYDGEDLTS